MTRKTFISLLLIGIVFLIGVILLLNLGKNIIYRDFLSIDDELPPRTPRTVEIPDEIREKYVKLSEKPLLIAQIKHGSYIDAVAFSPIDASLIVSRNQDDDSIKLWNINNPNKPIAKLKGDSFSFSTDGKLLAVNELRNGVRLWDIDNKKYIRTVSRYAMNAVFSPDGKWLAIDSSDIELWDIRNPKAIKEGPSIPTKGFKDFVAFSADGKLLATTDEFSGDVEVWKIVENQAIKKVAFNIRNKNKDLDLVEALEFVPKTDNPILAIAKDDDEIKHYSAIKFHTATDGQVNDKISTQPVFDIAFTPDGKTLVTGGVKEIKLWSVENGEQLTSIEGYTQWINCVDISSDGNFLAAGGQDGFLGVWNIADYLNEQHTTPTDIVKLIYFIPSDCGAQEDIPENLDKMIKSVQNYFADEMERHGFGRKTFTYETNEDGSAKIYLVEGRTTAEYYMKNTLARVKREIYDDFDETRNIYLILVAANLEDDLYNNAVVTAIPNSFKINYEKDISGQRGGTIIIPEDSDGYIPRSMLRMFGYAFGLGRDFSDPSYLMSYGSKQKQLSKKNAEWLDKSRLFNTYQKVFNKPSTIEKLSTLKGKVRFYLKDADGIHQVRLFVIPTNENPPLGYQSSTDPDKNKADWKSKYKGIKYVLYDYLNLDAETETTVEFDYPEYAGNEAKIHVIDGYGNIVFRKMNLVDRR